MRHHSHYGIVEIIGEPEILLKHFIISIHNHKNVLDNMVQHYSRLLLTQCVLANRQHDIYRLNDSANYPLRQREKENVLLIVRNVADAANISVIVISDGFLL